MGEFFKMFGIAVLVILADVVLFGLLAFIKVWDIDDDDAFLMPAILNGLCFAICAAILIGQWVS